jgi:hypothetical protein
LLFLGPVVDNLKAEASKASSEFRDLKNARVTPSTTTTNGQPLTRTCSQLGNDADNWNWEELLILV